MPMKARDPGAMCVYRNRGAAGGGGNGKIAFVSFDEHVIEAEQKKRGILMCECEPMLHAAPKYPYYIFDKHLMWSQQVVKLCLLGE